MQHFKYLSIANSFKCLIHTRAHKHLLYVCMKILLYYVPCALGIVIPLKFVVYNIPYIYIYTHTLYMYIKRISIIITLHGVSGTRIGQAIAFIYSSYPTWPTRLNQGRCNYTMSTYVIRIHTNVYVYVNTLTHTQVRAC